MTDRDAQQASGEGREPSIGLSVFGKEVPFNQAIAVFMKDYNALAAENARLRQRLTIYESCMTTEQIEKAAGEYMNIFAITGHAASRERT